MYRYFIALLFCLALIAAQAQSKKILIVSTNIDSVGKDKSGTYLKEIAYPFQQFVDKGYEVDIVTPHGGKASIYHSGTMPDVLTAIQNSELFKTKTEHTLTPDETDYRNYKGVYYPGGHGQYFDVLSDERIANIAAAIHESGGVLAAAGHGMSSWINIRLNNCRFLVEGINMTCFPSWAEKEWMNISGYGKYLPMNMEEQLARRGAKLVLPGKEQANDTKLTNITDEKNKIVTGSFAFNAHLVAAEMIRLLSK